MANIICVSCELQKSADEVQDVFDEVGNELYLSALLEEHFQLQVVREENKPKPICYECLEKLTQCIDAEAYAMQQLENDEFSEETQIKLVAKEERLESPSVEENKNFSLQLMHSDNNGDVYMLLAEGDEEESIQVEDDYTELYDLAESTSYISNEVRDTDHDLEHLSTYLDNCINNDLEAININVELECESCIQKFDKYQELLEHLIANHHTKLNGKQKYLCTLPDCKKSFDEVKCLARHILLRHCEVHNLQIIGECIHCHFRFTNFIDFNKHSCCQQNFQAKARTQCQYCNKMFISTRRCKFHTQFHLPERRQMLCFICEQTFDDDVKLFEHVTYEHRPIPPYTCTDCDITFKKELVYMQHQAACKEKTASTSKYKKQSTKNEPNSKEHNFQCNECWMTFNNPVRCGNHIKRHQQDDRVNVYVCSDCGVVGKNLQDIEQSFVGKCEHNTTKKDILSVVFTCRNCALDFRTTKQYIAHLSYTTHNKLTYKCPECFEVFNEEQAIRKHVATDHETYENRFYTFPIKRLFACFIDKCDQTFELWMEFQKHRCIFHKNRICKNCQVEVTAAEFLAHKKLCKNSTTHRCQYCGLEYKSKMSCAVHIARSHNAKQSYVCSFCKAIFKTENSMQAHIDYMHVPIKCTECYKVIKNQRNYDVHIRAVHQKVQRHFCSHCNKGFYYKSECVAHEKNLHSGTLFKCSKCDFVTHYEESLEVHMAIHINDLTLKCPHCSKRFVRKNSLDVHIKSHTNDKRFVCSERLENGCNKAFVSNYLLVSHIKKCHKKDSQPKESSTNKRKRKKISEETLNDETKDQPRRLSLRKRNKS